MLPIVAQGGGKVLEVGLSIASVAYGAPLGDWAGVLTRRASERRAMVGMLSGFPTMFICGVFPFT